MQKGFCIYLAFFLYGAVAWAQDDVDLDLSFADEDKKVQDTSNQSLSLIPTKGPDRNMNYTGVYKGQSLEPLPASVRKPALGARGYRPNLVGVGYGERTPGFGGFLEYNFNRLGMGLAASLRKEEDGDFGNFISLYANYIWLPTDISPYILMGGGYAQRADNNVGFLTGIGLAAQVYEGLTLNMGYTHFTSMRKGFWGGSAGWAF
jgi:opacity protein-like surface antigen